MIQVIHRNKQDVGFGLSLRSLRKTGQQEEKQTQESCGFHNISALDETFLASLLRFQSFFHNRSLTQELANESVMQGK